MNVSAVTNRSSKQILIECLLVMFLTFFYGFGVLIASRESLLFEFFVAVVFPLFCGVFGLLKIKVLPRLFSLIVIETLFNILVLIAKFSIIHNYSSINKFVAYGFIGFFIIQVCGFMISQYHRRSWHGLSQSALFGVLIVIWLVHGFHDLNIIDQSGRFLMWGSDAPLPIRVYYLFWLLTVTLVDTIYLPNLREFCVQLTLTIIAFFSGEFFHARILLASNSFVINLVFLYGISKPQSQFGVMSGGAHKFFLDKLQPAIKYFTTAVTLTIALYYIFLT
jgi:hypothetical protein